MDRTLLEILVCPNCKGRLKLSDQQDELLCRFDHIAFPIRNNVPILLLNEARKWQEGDHK